MTIANVSADDICDDDMIADGICVFFVLMAVFFDFKIHISIYLSMHDQVLHM